MSFLAISATQIVQYINYGFIGIILLGALIGLSRGIFKSVYYFIVFIAMTLLAWFVLSPIICQALLNANLNLQVGDLYISTIKESLPQIVENINPNFGSLAVEGTETYALLMELTNMIFSIVFTLIFIILTMTLFKIIFGIIYLIIRPKKKDENGKRLKKKWGSRLSGFVLGGVHALLILLIIAIPLSGISRIGNELKESQTNNTENVYYAITTDDNKVLLLSNKKQLSNPIDDMVPFLDVYRSSLLGKTFNVFKANGEPVDEKLFDSILVIEYNDEKISLSSDVSKVLSIYQELSSEIDGEWTIEAIFNIDSDKLKNVVRKVGELDLIDVIIPVATEVVFEGEILPSNISEQLADLDYKDIIKEMKQIDLKADVVNLGLSLIDISNSGVLNIKNVSLNKNSEEEKPENSITVIELLNSLNPELVKNGFDTLGEVKLIDVIGDVALNVLSKASFLDKYLDGAGLTHDDIDLEGISLSENLSSIGDLVLSIQGLGLNDEDIKQVNLSKYEEQKTNKVVDALYDFTLFSKNTVLLASIVREEFLPSEYKDLLPAREMENGDMKSLLKVAKAVLGSQGGIPTALTIESIINSGNVEVFLAEAEHSEYVYDMINGAGNLLLEIMCNTFNLDKTKLDTEGIDWVDELEPLNNLIEIAAGIGVDFNGGGIGLTFDTLTDDQISLFADAIYSSQVMTRNNAFLLSIVKTYIPESYANLIPTSLDNAKTFESFLKIARTASKTTTSSGQIDVSSIDTEELKDAVSSLDGEQINSLLTGLIDATGIIDTTNLELPEIDTSTEEGVDEVQKLLEAVETISTVSSVTDFKDLNEEDIEKITSSKVATSVAVEMITQQTQEGGLLSGFLVLDGIEKDEWVDTEEGSGELKKLVEATNVLMDDSGNIDVSINKISSLTDDDITTLTDSKVVTNSLNENLNDIIANEITNTFDQEKYGYELNLGSVEVKEGETTSEVWAEEITTVRDVVEISSNLTGTDLANEDNAKSIGELIDAGKSSQIIGSSAISIADSLLKDAYSGIEGYDAPEVTSETNFAEEFMKLQALLAQQNGQ